MRDFDDERKDASTPRAWCTHANNPYGVTGGKVCLKDTGFVYDDPGMLLDAGAGVVLKVGEFDWVRGVGNKYMDFFRSQCPGRMPQEYRLLHFSKCRSLSAHHACALIGYLGSGIQGSEMKEILAMPEEKLRSFADGLLDQGW